MIGNFYKLGRLIPLRTQSIMNQTKVGFYFSNNQRFFRLIDFEPKYLNRIPWIFQPVQPIIHFIRDRIYNFHEWVQLPWWAIIIMSSIIIRSTIFPLIFIQMKKISKLGPIFPLFAHIKDSFRESSMSKFQLLKTTIKIYRALSKQEKFRMSTVFIYNIVYYPFLIIMIYSLRSLLAFDEVAQTSFLHIPNLGDIDPYYILPTLTIALYYYNLQRYITKQNRNTIVSRIRIGCQYLLIAFFPFLCCWPAGLSLYMCSSAFVSVIHSTITKSMWFQGKLNPKILYYHMVLGKAEYDKGTSESIIEGIKTADQSWKQKSIEQKQLVEQTQKMLKDLEKEEKKEKDKQSLQSPKP